MRGIFQAGLVHAFIVSGYFPGVIAGTSAGCITGTVLALAAQIEDPARRLQLAADHIAAWQRNPAETVRRNLVRGPFGNLIGDLADIKLTLGELVSLFDRASNGSRQAILRLVVALPFERMRVILGLLSAIKGGAEGVWSHLRSVLAKIRLPGDLEKYAHHLLDVPGDLDLTRDATIEAVQHLLTAYGMDKSLVPDVVGAHFGTLVKKYGPKGGKTTFADLTKTQLVFQLANLSQPDGESGDSQLIDVGCAQGPDRLDFSSANLLAALRAGCAFAPLFPGVHAKDLELTLYPAGLQESDVLMDAGVIQKDPLSPVISRWARGKAAGPFRLFAVHLEPLGPTKDDSTSPFFGPALHSLTLRDGLDARYATNVITMVTEMVEAIQANPGAAPMPNRQGRGTSSGGKYVAVHISEIAPRKGLPFAELSVPKEKDLIEACAAGCRSGLESLHAETLRELFKGDELIPCDDLLKKLGKMRGEPLVPLAHVCAGCTRELAPPPVIEPVLTKEQVALANDFAPFHEAKRLPKAPGGASPRPLTIIVPAGGVFLGIFQFGAIAALVDYEVQPDLYAGASVGTLFSSLLQACLKHRDTKLPRVVDLARRVPEWVDAVFHDEVRTRRPGYVDAVVHELERRWNSQAVQPLRDLRPREIAKMLEAAAPPTSGSDAPWKSFRTGLAAWLFTPMASRKTGEPRLADPTPYGLESHASWAEVHGMLQALTRLRLKDALGLLDKVAANLDLFNPGATADDGEIIGFDSIARELRDLVFEGANPTLAQHAHDQQARFIFTVTNHSKGTLESFGFEDGLTPLRTSPSALQATLAASSFPLAFRRRSRKETFPDPGVDDPGTRYADGGILNNFPSDIAFAYLHTLTTGKHTKWIGEARHRMILLSLTSPSMLPHARRDDDRLLINLARAMARSDDEKVAKTLRTQEHINTLATEANRFLRTTNDRQAIIADMDLISPTYMIYPHAFAFKPYLGFKLANQLEMVASGCRRTRLALEWREDQLRPGVEAPKTRLPLFLDEVKAEVDRVKGSSVPDDADMCVFGRFNPLARASGGQAGRCPFTHAEDTRDVFNACKLTIDKELEVRNPKLYKRLGP